MLTETFKLNQRENSKTVSIILLARKFKQRRHKRRNIYAIKIRTNIETIENETLLILNLSIFLPFVYSKNISYRRGWLVGSIIWHTNSSELFDVRSCLQIYIIYKRIFKRTTAHLFAYSYMVSTLGNDLDISIWPIYGTLTDTTTPSQSGPDNNEASPSDSLVLYSRYSLVGVLPLNSDAVGVFNSPSWLGKLV